jgi:hypothetical protein
VDKFVPRTLKDSLLTFEAGVNAGIAPELLKRNQLANAINTTVRGDFIGPRPYFRQMYLDFNGDVALQALVTTSLFQAAAYYQPDNGPESILAALAGNLIQFTIGTDRARVISASVTGGQYQIATSPQQWMWQSEKWMVWNDGKSNPVFFDGALTARSNYNVAVPFTTTTATNAVTILASPNQMTVNVASALNLVVGDILTLGGFGLFTVVDISAPPAIKMIKGDSQKIGVTIPVGTTISWSHPGTQLPPGRMGTYGMGRTWMALTDGRQFIASDGDGGSSGTVGNNYRDAVLNITENTYLAGGGNFAIPGGYGSIKAMCFAATLDASLGQGPLQVFTPSNVFSCQSPPDRLIWQNITNPILTESLKGGGGLAQDSTIPFNGDTIMRDKTGIRSLILGRRDFASWGNSPISNEVDPILSPDNQNLNILAYGSAIIFDNRMLMTTGGVPFAKGVYWKGIVPLNADSVSTLRGKQPSVYDAVVWEGLNILKLVVGQFSGVERAFAFTWNTDKSVMELFEILPSVRTELGATPAVITDSGGRRITMRMEFAVLDFGQKDPKDREYGFLANGEIYVDQLQGKVDFRVWYQPDNWPCWVPWNQWTECASTDSPISKPQFRPRMGLGEPSILACDNVTNRPLREGYTFQIAIEITGHCTFKGGAFWKTTMPQPPPAPVCQPLCQP